LAWKVEEENQLDFFQKPFVDVKSPKQSSKPLVEFLDGSDHSFSSDEDNVKILAMIAFALYILYIRYGGDDDLDKLFVPLSKDAAVVVKGEEAASISELKMTVIKALRVLIAKLDTKSQADALINNQQNKQ
jgi:hypothetical protein